jgi:phenylacetate-CoA ligase
MNSMRKSTAFEESLHKLIKERINKDQECHRFVGKESLEQLTRADIDRYQLFKLRNILSYVYKKSAFYRELFDKHGVKVDEIRSLDDLAKIPFTNPADLSQQPYHFACVPVGDVARITTFTSSGTIGPQKRVFCTQGDLETMTDYMGVGMRTVATEGDVVQILLPSARPNDQADLLAKGVRKMGGVAVISGLMPPPEEQLKILDESHSTILFAIVSHIYRITQETRRNHDLRGKGVKALFLTTEYLSDAMRKQLQNAWNCDVRLHYGLTEMGLGVAVECNARNGYHFNEADLLVEVVDPKTGAVLGNDAEGELVFTTLVREAMPLIRYRTHDISKLISGSCECGASTLKKISKVAKRLEAIVKTSAGDELYPSMFDDILFNIPDIVDYQVTLGKEGDMDVLLLKVELTRESGDIREAISKAIQSHAPIQSNVQASRMALPRVELVPQGTLMRFSTAKKLIIDGR